MNLIVDPNPKDDQSSLNSALAKHLAEVLGGPIQSIRLYDSDQKYFHYEFQQSWIDLMKQSKNLIFPVPMWNFGMPAALKDFFDKVIKKGELWDFDEKKNYKGLLKDKSAFIILTMGDAQVSNDFVIPHLRALLGFLGVEDIRAYWLGGVRKKSFSDKIYMGERTQEMLGTFGLK